jgi:hypothetical protein
LDKGVKTKSDIAKKCGIPLSGLSTCLNTQSISAAKHEDLD